jgi:uncharacterized membrane protein
MDILDVVATWLHTLAVLIAIGYYGVLGRFVLPALRRTLDGPSTARALVAIEHRARPFVILAVVLFLVTGGVLLLVDPRYAGIGNIGASTWTVLMLLKHLVVGGVVVLGVVVDLLVDQASRAPAPEERDALVGRVGLLAEVATGLGALAILLTAMAGAA